MNSKFRGSRFLRATSRGLSSSAGVPAKVIDFKTFFNRRQVAASHSVFYLSDSGQWLNSLSSFPFLQVEDIRSMSILKTKLISQSPELILIEDTLSWADPIATISLLSSLAGAPIVMVCQRSTKSHDLIKKAYAAGVHDTLYAPLCREDLDEILDVLLKLKRSALLHP